MSVVEITDDRLKVLDHIPVGICIIDRNYKVLFWNLCMEDWCAISKDEILGSDFGSHFPHFKKEQYYNRILGLLDGGAPTIFSSQLHKNIFRSYLPNGEPRTQHTTVISVPSFDGEDFYALFAVEDVTELTNHISELCTIQEELQKAGDEMEDRVKRRTAELASTNDLLQQEIADRIETEQTLQHERDRAQKYLDVAGVIMIVIDNEQKLNLINKKGCDILECQERDAVGKNWCDNFVPRQVRGDVRTIISGLLNGQIELYEYYENAVLARSGTERIIAWHNAVLYNKAGGIEALISSGEDITERKQAEEAIILAYNDLKTANEELKEMQSQLVQSEKMAAIGQLSAGFAHEINTPVGYVASNFQTLESYVSKFKDLFDAYNQLFDHLEILSKTELLKKSEAVRKLREESQLDFILEDIQELFGDSKEGLDRVTGIVQNLRDFSRTNKPGSIEEYDLNNGIETTLNVAKNEIKYDANIKTEFSDIPLILCNSGQINQVFLHILVNAVQAIKLQEKERMGTITIKTFGADDEVTCEISDDGPGIVEEQLQKIFNPFFTTKPAGKGTGLGLSISHDIIVNKHKGKLLVESTVGEGTKFIIKLPIKVTKPENEK